LCHGWGKEVGAIGSPGGGPSVVAAG